MTLRDLAASLGDGTHERAVARDVEAELEAHLELAAAALEADGHDADEARALALERFGDLERVRRECLRIRTGGNHAMKIALLASNLVLVAALLVSLLVARAQHVRAQEAMEHALQAQVLALEAAERARAVAAPTGPVVVEVGDVIETFDQHRIVDFSEQAVVQPDGQVLLHDVGWIEVAGLTREEVEQRLTEAYAPYYQDLTVNVIVHKAAREPQHPGAPAGRSASAGAEGSEGQVVSGGTRIGVGDTIEILDRNGRFDLGGPRQVDADGRVLLPRLGWTSVAGLERDQLAEQLTSAYQPYFGQLPVDVLLRRAAGGAEGVATPARVAVEAVLGGATTVIEAGDSIEVLDRQRQHDFGGRAKVAPDGKVLLPHVGWIEAAGMSRDEFARSLTDLLAPLLASPPVVDVVLYTSAREVRTLHTETFDEF